MESIKQAIEKIMQDHEAEGAVLILHKNDNKGQRVCFRNLTHEQIRECLSVAIFHNEAAQCTMVANPDDADFEVVAHEPTIPKPAANYPDDVIQRINEACLTIKTDDPYVVGKVAHLLREFANQWQSYHSKLLFDRG